VSGKGSGSGYDTNNDTNVLATKIPHPQVIEIDGRPVRTQTADLHSVNLPRIQKRTTRSLMVLSTKKKNVERYSRK
jgi:hypothetical protein